MIDKALLVKIRKCLALSASSNEHEAAAALAKARELMAEHGVSDADLALADVEESPARGSRTQQPSRWEQYLCAAVRRALQVEVILDDNLDRRYIGRGARPEIASYAFTALYRRLKTARAAYIARHLRRTSHARKRVRADAFCEGWALAVYFKIQALAPRELVDEGVQTYIARQHPGLVEIAPRAAASDRARTRGDLNRGFEAGEDVDIHQGVGAEQRREIAHAG